MNPSGKPSEDGYMTRRTNLLVKLQQQPGASYFFTLDTCREGNDGPYDYLWPFALN